MAAPWDNVPKDGEYVDLEKAPTPEEEREEFKTDDERKAEEVIALKLKNNQFKDDMAARRKYAGRAYTVTLFWLFSLILFVLLQYIKPCGWQLTEVEFVTVVTTTTASVFGFWMLVLNYLFKR